MRLAIVVLLLWASVAWAEEPKYDFVLSVPVHCKTLEEINQIIEILNAAAETDEATILYWQHHVPTEEAEEAEEESDAS